MVKQGPRGVTLQGLVEAYGKNEAARIVTRQVTQTIIMKKRSMKKDNPTYTVLLKDPITGKLIVDTDHVLRLNYINKDGSRREWFTYREVELMRKYMPGFDKYYEVRRYCYANEEE